MRYGIFFLLLFSFTSIDAQSVNNSVEFSTPEKQKLVNKYSCFFRTMEDQSRLIRIGVASLSRTPGILSSTFPVRLYGLELGLEQKIVSGFSLIYTGNLHSFSYDTYIDHPSFNAPREDIANMVSFKNALEIRHYLHKKRKIKQGLSGNNLSGFYLGLKGEYDHWFLATLGYHELFSTPLIDVSTIKGRTLNVTFSGGWQQQFGKNGFINFSLGAGKAWRSKDISTLSFNNEGQLKPSPSVENWILDYRLTLGWAFGKSNSYNPEDCSVIQYFKEEKSLLKIDILNIISSISDQGIGGSFSIEYEQKLGNSPFSVNPYFFIPYTLGFEKEIENRVSTVIGTETRYYYNLKKRIRKGKTGNNLFANYFGAKIAYHTNTRDNLPYGYGIMWGLQRRLFNTVFIDYSLGNYSRASFQSPDFEVYTTMFSELQIGLAF